jgi:TolB-like protein
VSFFSELKRRNVIRVALAYLVLSWIVLQIADVLVDTMELPGVWSRAVLGLLLVGFLPTLVFAWVYELTPEGIKKESEIPPAESITAHTAKKLNVAVIVLLVAAMGMFAADRFLGPRAPATPTAESAPATAAPAAEPVEEPVADEPALALGVAVLPFANLSTEAENAFFASGVHEDVLTYLSRVGDLRVISRTSVENYADSTLSLPAIGRELGVSHVVEGSVRRAGNRVRVTVQLIDVETDAHIWSENYDRTLDDIFAIQTEIAQAIVAQLETELTPGEAESLAAVETTNIRAYELYVEGREFFAEGRRSYSVPAFARSAARFQGAVAEDPGYLSAWKGLVDACGMVIWFGSPVQSADCRSTIEAAVEHMQKIAPDSADTRTAMGIYRYRVARDLAGAVDILAPVVSERPNDVDALSYLAFAGRRLGLWETALDAVRRVVVLDPANRRGHRNLIEVLVNSANWGEAVDAALAAAQRFPDDTGFRLDHAALLYLHRGELSEYREVLPQMPPDQRISANYPPFADGVFTGVDDALAWVQAIDIPGGPWVVYKSLVKAWIYYAWGEDVASQFSEEERARLEAAIEEVAGEPVANGVIAQMYALLGDRDQALEWREKTLQSVEGRKDVLDRNTVRVAAAEVLALTGDAERAWRDLEPLIRQPSGPTEWQLYFDLPNRRMYAGVPGYEALRAKLTAELEARQ